GFNCEMHRRGCRVVSADPIYRFSAAQLALRFNETRDTILRKTVVSRENFVWNEIRSIERLGELRMQAMSGFLLDLPRGLSEGRYVTAELPQLPFADSAFDLALCSHFLFTYSDLLSLEFHVESIRELCRVAREARIFPLLPNFAVDRSLHLPPLINHLTADGYLCEIIRVPYEFQRGANEMFRATRSVQ
ncbi:MAG: SAM-dependent methyltransferase, partial [Acidobacteriota bacterium]|nr:SAM-dependent methyltransferase [Acidobacteriota bacterium]